MSKQLTINFDQSLAERHLNLLECVACGIYHRTLKRVAVELDKAPGNLSRELAGDSDRHFSVESLERYIQTSGDINPILYLIARYMGNQAESEAAALSRIETLLAEVTAVMGQSGIGKAKAKR